MRIRKFKNIIVTITLFLGIICSIPALADTIYYKGYAVYWNYGRFCPLRDWSFSEVQSSNFDHTATANSVSSGWQPPCVVAYAKCHIGVLGHATAAWNCRG
ncbi:MAG: hypothetical protein LBS28_02735 [Streptococcaceae bacterium]|jgi:hypothetical protein|nr:hypothetical protein [Streptococcaceae bacterium]